MRIHLVKIYIISMDLSSSVFATKYLRDRSVSIADRVHAARTILRGSADLCLPRKESVLLNWVFDAFKDEKNCANAELWALFTQLWSANSKPSRDRIFRNHRFVIYFTAALSSPQTAQTLLETAARAFTAVSESNEPLEFANSAQVSSLVLAYLSNEAAVSEQKLAEFRTKLFSSVRMHTNLFQTGSFDALDLILRENNEEMRQLFLTSYLRNKENKTSLRAEINVNSLINAVLDVDAGLIEPRMTEIVKACPNCLATALNRWDALSPLTLTAEIARKFIGSSIDSVICVLQLRPAAVFDDLDTEARVLERADKALNNGNAELMCALLRESSLHRKLTAVLLDWPYTKYPEQANKALQAVCLKAFESLSAKEVCRLIRMRPKSLPLIISSLNYKLAYTPSVKELLQTVCNEETDELKLAALQICPNLTVSTSASAVLKLRQIELDLMDESHVQPILNELETGFNGIALRYFPLIASAVNTDAIEPFLLKCDDATRRELCNSTVFDYKPFVTSLVNVLIALNDFESLKTVPKQLFTWPQRHAAVLAAMKGEFSRTCALVSDLLDTENLPDVHALLKYLESAHETDAETFVRIAAKLGAELENARFSNWQQTCVNAVLNVPVQFDESMVSALCTVVDHLPPQTVFRLAAALAAANKPEPRVFRRVCALKPHWSLVTALFIASGCVHADAYAEYCQQLSAAELACLCMQACSENQFGVLESLVSRGVEFSFVYALLKLELPTNAFWRLCDAALRSNKLVNQFGVEYMLQLVKHSGHFALKCGVVYKIVHKRSRIRGRVHLVVNALTQLMQEVSSQPEADLFARLVDALCKPTSVSRQTLKSVVLMERRMVQKHLPVLVANYVSLALQSPVVGTYLRESMYPALSLLGTEGLRGVAASMDFSSHTYLRRLFDEYKARAMWTGD